MFIIKERYDYADLLQIMELLRAPNGCMWDREQDHHSIRRNFLEEAYEAVEAIDNQDTALLQEELGDVLLQVVFHAQIEAEKGVFTMQDVADGVCKKLVFRHPHIFGSTTVHSTDDVLQNWEDLKKIEKQQKTATDSLVAVARSLPALIRAEKVQGKAAKTGFDFANMDGAMAKLQEEVAELSCALEGDGNPVEELGDVLFAAVKIARFLKIDPEEALERTTDKFIHRFDSMEQCMTAAGESFADLSLDELIARWNIAKGAKHEEK